MGPTFILYQVILVIAPIRLVDNGELINEQ